MTQVNAPSVPPGRLLQVLAHHNATNVRLESTQTTFSSCVQTAHKGSSLHKARVLARNVPMEDFQTRPGYLTAFLAQLEKPA
jgi:hypothetical protein